MDISINERIRKLRAPRKPEARPLTRLEWVMLGAATLILFAVSAPILGAVYGVHVGLALGLGIVHSAALLLAPLRPRIAIATHLAATITLAIVMPVGGGVWPIPVPELISLTLLLGIIALRETLTLAATAWALNMLVLGTLLTIAALRFGTITDAMLRAAQAQGVAPAPIDFTPDLINLVVTATYTALVVVAAYNVSRRNWSKLELVQAKRTAEIEHERRMGAEERSRIAREMHDVVAHSMSIVHMQASSAPFRVTGLNDEAKAEFESIASSARDALREMRTLLGVLRLDEDTALAPQPQLADLETLVDGSTNGGIEAALHLDTDRDPSELPETVQLTAYRVVQEALSNVIRHAPGSSAEVSVLLLGPELTVRVTNTAQLASTGPDDETDPNRVGVPLASGGMGILGMRERVTTLGGHLVARPQLFGGYVVEARLPAAQSTQSAQSAQTAQAKPKNRQTPSAPAGQQNAAVAEPNQLAEPAPGPEHA